MRTASALLKTKLVIAGLKEITIPVQYTITQLYSPLEKAAQLYAKK